MTLFEVNPARAAVFAVILLIAAFIRAVFDKIGTARIDQMLNIFFK